MRTVVVDRQGVTLKHEAGAVCVRDVEGTLQRVPLSQMDRLVIENEALISVNLVRQLAAEGIPLVITRGRSRASAALLAPSAGDALRRLRQAKAWLDRETRLAFARQVVALRIRSQAGLLRRWAEQQPSRRYLLLRAASALGRLLRRARDAASPAAVRGVEGVAARLHFGGMRLLVAPALGFPGRRRRPPTDPVNAALSLGFTLLHARALECVHRAGLDPCLGALHEPSHGRPSLACDLVEPERCCIEAWVVAMFRRRELEARDFGQTGAAFLLLKAARPTFFAGIEPVLRAAERRIHRRVALLIRRLPELGE